MQDYIYLDYAAATPMDSQVIDAMTPFFNHKFFNPSATYGPAKFVKNDLNNARKQIASWLGAKSEEIIFTAGGTESNNLAINGVMSLHKTKNIIISSVEHDSVLYPAKKYVHKVAPVDDKGVIILDKLLSLVDNNTTLISVMYANNEIGSIQPIKDIALGINSIKKQRLLSNNLTPLLLHVDASQAVNYLDIHHARLGIDLMTLNGGKIYGPKQSGILFVKSGVSLEPSILGGGQEKNLRSGTENVAASIGLAKALDIAQSSRKEEHNRLADLQKHFFKSIAAKIPSVTINGSIKSRLPNNLHITIPGADNERLLSQLDDRNIYCAAGSACSASSVEPSHVLKAMGIGDDLARSSLRLSMGRQTTKKDIDDTINALDEIVNKKVQYEG
ncbi:MAG: cysteine desulfurase family protein [Candidatus Saccharibacteria bacterium]